MVVTWLLLACIFVRLGRIAEAVEERDIDEPVDDWSGGE